MSLWISKVRTLEKKTTLLRQLSALLNRYSASHLQAHGGPFQILTADEKPIGAVDSITLSGGRLHIAGWARGNEVILFINGERVSARPNIIREDVARAHDIDPAVGFDMTLPLGPITLSGLNQLGLQILEVPGQTKPVSTPLRLHRLRRIQLSILAKFVGAFVPLLPSGLAWLITRDPKYRERIKRGLQLTTNFVASNLVPGLFEPRSTEIGLSQAITIIMPVYNAFHLLPEALDRVHAHTDLPWRLIIIEDGSTDAQVRPFLREWSVMHDQNHPEHAGRVTVLENAENLGFIRSVNRGFEQAMVWNDPVVLLNSDALVPEGWASRLMHPLLTGQDVATVTPMSNDAEIFTAPVICRRYDLEAGQGDAIDAVARTLNGDVDLADAPTGVGFCMGLSASYLKKLPTLDTIFGRGYGEEVDWCQRVRGQGGRHLGVSNVFVEHRGGQSFGSDAKLRLVTNNNAIISKRYPDYDAEVQTFIRMDPMRSTRLALGMAWAASLGHEVPVFLAHNLGGGADHYLAHRIATRYTDKGLPSVVIRVGGSERWQVELITPFGVMAGTTSDLNYALNLLAPLTQRRVVYSCGVGDTDPAELPDVLLQLSAYGAHSLDVLFHDFYPISPSYTLLDSDGIYRGTPRPSITQDAAHSLSQAKGSDLSLKNWQDRWAKVITAAQNLIVFSEDSAVHVRRTYTEAADKLVIRPHSLLAAVPHLPPPAPHARRIVGVLGNIGYNKGAALLGGLAKSLEAQKAGLVIIGTIDPVYALPPSVPVHGPYQIEDLPRLAALYGVTDWLIPSVWPETFSYTTHEALASGLPVHAFNIGAQGAAVAKSAHGHTIQFTSDENLMDNVKTHFGNYFKISEQNQT